MGLKKIYLDKFKLKSVVCEMHRQLRYKYQFVHFDQWKYTHQVATIQFMQACLMLSIPIFWATYPLRGYTYWPESLLGKQPLPD